MIGIEPVCHPGRVVPCPPGSDKERGSSQGAQKCRVLKQKMRQLDYGENLDQVKEELHIGDMGCLAVPELSKRVFRCYDVD